MTTTTLTLTDFLLARIAEDEVWATDAKERGYPDWAASDLGKWCIHGEDQPMIEAETRHIARHDPTRVLAECEMKRRIVELADEAEGLDDQVWADRGLSTDEGYNDPRCGERILCALALPYADHPDYDEAWRP